MFSSSIKCFQINLTCICSVFNVLSQPVSRTACL
jgi:hypothetical protein